MTRDEFLALRHTGFPIHVDVEVPQLGTVKVKKLNAGEKDRLEAGGREVAGHGLYRARMVAYTVMDERGAMVFTDEDIAAIALMDPDILDPIVRAAAKINGYSAEDQEELRKNSSGQAVTS